MSWIFNSPGLAACQIGEQGLLISAWEHTTVKNGFVIPVRSALVWVNPQLAAIQVRVDAVEESTHSTAVSPQYERMKNGETGNQGIQQEIHLDEWYAVDVISHRGPYQLWSVSIFGASWDPGSQTWYIPEHYRVEIQTGLSGPSLTGTGIPDAFRNQLLLNDPPYSPSPSPLTGSDQGLGTGYLKLFVLEDGIYRIPFDSLAPHLDPDWPAIASHELQLFNQGMEIPIHVSDGGDGSFDGEDHFVFIGYRNQSGIEGRYYNPYSDVNVYWLYWGNELGLRLIEESGLPGTEDLPGPQSFWETRHLEMDEVFDRLGQVDNNLPTITRDHHFWDILNSGGTAELAFYLPDPNRNSSENIKVRVALHGLTYSESGSNPAPHSVFAFLNENSIGEGSWTQQESYVLESPSALNLSHQILASNGNNLMSFFSPVSDEPGRYDRVVINWLEIEYERELKADQDQLRFRKSYINPSGLLEMEIGELSSADILLIKEGMSLIRDFEIREWYEENTVQYSAIFQDNVNNSTPDYWIASGNGILAPRAIQADTLQDLRSQDADMIIITPPDMMVYLAPYLEFKSSQGWQPVAVSLTDIYDEFNFGVVSPEAIKRFLAYARQYWPAQPEYALLIGDATSDPRETKNDVQARYTPTYFMQTYGWGAAESDYWYALLEGDDLIPEMHLGRIPSSNADQLEMTLAKLIAYEDDPPPDFWQNEILVIAGFENTFKYQSENLLTYSVPEEYVPYRLFIDRDSEGQAYWGDTDTLLTYLNNGKQVINFLGHGGGAIWADRSLFTREDVARLHSDSPPAFVTSMTCFTGSFAQVRGLGEVMFTESPTGAIGWLGSSGVGWVINDYLMVQPLLTEVLTSGQTLGEAVDAGRMTYYTTASRYAYLKPSMLYQYNLFGDPTLSLDLPESLEILVCDTAIYHAGDQVTVSSTGMMTGELQYQVIAPDGQPVFAKPQDHSVNGNESIVLDSEDWESGEYRMIYSLLPDDGGDLVHGSIIFTIDQDWFEHEPPESGELELGSDLQIRVSFHSQSIIDSVVMRLFAETEMRLHLENTSASVWDLPAGTKVFAGSDDIPYFFHIYSDASIIFVTETYLLAVPRARNVTPVSMAASILGTEVGIALEYHLEGADTAWVAVVARDTLLDSPTTTSWLLPGRIGSNSVFLPLIRPPGDRYLQLELMIFNEDETTDNTLDELLSIEAIQVLPSTGMTFTGQSADTLALWDGWLSVDSESDSGWISLIRSTGNPELSDGITFLADSVIYELRSNLPVEQLTLSVDTQVMFRPAHLPVWQILETTGAGDQISNGELALGQITDATGPDIQLMIAGQRFFDGGYVDTDAEVHLVCEDPNGFRWNPEDVSISVDDLEMDVHLGDTSAAGLLLTAWSQLDLGNGQHMMRFSARDALGNWSTEQEVLVDVIQDPRIIDYGNFPNPFTSETLFIYELTQPLDEVTIDIYTLAGHKIQTLDDFNARVDIPLGAIGYHEVPWNGRDRYEDFVANGVYFYRIMGESENGILEGPVGKIMKSR